MARPVGVDRKKVWELLDLKVPKTAIAEMMECDRKTIFNISKEERVNGQKEDRTTSYRGGEEKDR